MKRRLFNLLAGVSLLLCVAVLSLWTHSYFRSAALHFFAATDNGGISRDHYALSEFGGLVVGENRNTFSRRSAGTFGGMIGPLPSGQRRYSFILAGFAFDRRTTQFIENSARDERPQDLTWQSETSRVLRIPYWFLSLVTLVVPSIWLYRVTRRTYTPGLCLTCGYDLRATPDRCPECGTVPAKRAVER
jgi:hypothetical protein